MRSKPFHLLIFDWDGTLMDSAARIVECLKSAARDCGESLRPDQQLRNVIGLGLEEAIRALYPTIDAKAVTTMAQAYRDHYLYKSEIQTPLFPGVAALLEELRQQDYWLAVATGKSRQGLDKAMEEHGVSHHFFVTRCASETLSKPHPQMLHEILDELGIDSRDALMIGDTEYDMQLANNAGTSALAVSYGVHAPDRLLKHEPLGCLDDIRDLPAWLKLT